MSKNRIWLLLGIVMLSLLLRGWAVLRLPLDFDEPVYLSAGADYARFLAAGDWRAVVDYPENREHPPLVKLLYGGVFWLLGGDIDQAMALYAGRALSATLGVLATLALTLFNPLAGGLLAAHTLVIKYTSQVYLEALPHLASLAAVLFFVRCRSGRDRWFWLSAVALGVTAAAKFAYAPVVLVILYLAIREKRLAWRDLVLYLALAGVAFWLLNPSLWRDPIGRLADALFFHLRYSQGEHVQQVGYPWYQPLYWISRSPPSTWHPEVFVYFGIDGAVFVFAMAGLYWEWRERRWVVVWILSGLLFLLIWPTKWPQYTLLLVPALCLSAATALLHFFHWAREQETYWRWFTTMFPGPPPAFWIALAVLALAFGVSYTVVTLEQARGRLGWSHLSAQNSMLPSNSVYDILPGRDGEMIFATERGVVIWTPAAGTDSAASWLLPDSGATDLLRDRVLAVLQEADGDLWFGTRSGLVCYDGTDWQLYGGEMLGLQGDAIYALAAGSDGRLWVGGSSGAAVFDGDGWTSFETELGRGRVLSLAVEARSEGDWVWFGGDDRVSRWESGTDEWFAFTDQDLGVEWGGVVDLMVDSAGQLWMGTLGGGLCLWDGSEWTLFRTGNSGLPFNTVNAVAEVEPGVLWVGTALPNVAGGALAAFDGTEWSVLSERNSGYSNAEPLAIVVDGDGRRWIGTRSAGVYAYQPQE